MLHIVTAHIESQSSFRSHNLHSCQTSYPLLPKAKVKSASESQKHVSKIVIHNAPQAQPCDWYICDWTWHCIYSCSQDSIFPVTLPSMSRFILFDWRMHVAPLPQHRCSWLCLNFQQKRCHRLPKKSQSSLMISLENSAWFKQPLPSWGLRVLVVKWWACTSLMQMSSPNPISQGHDKYL